jgi:hypothetical protein
MHRSKTWQKLKQKILILFLPLLPEKEAKQTTRLYPLLLLCNPDPAWERISHPALCPGKSSLLMAAPKDLSAQQDFSTPVYFLQSSVSGGKFPHLIKPLL